MRRILLAFILGLLIGDAAGLDGLIVPEPCTSLADQAPDNTCPATCSRCSCGQPMMAVAVSLMTVMSIRMPIVDHQPVAVPSRPPSAIFHVPKSTSLST